MRYQAHTVDTRIHKFMEKKINKFPELRDRSSSGSTIASRGHVWDDIVELFRYEGAR